jgi:glycosyltransferase involved in cell wall biosynthesis
MRIAVWYYLPSGGAKRALYYHVRELVRLGHEVEVWRPPVPGLDFGPIASLAPEHEVPLEIQSASERTYFSRVQGFVDEQRRRFEGIDRHSLECAKQMKSKGFDVLLSANCLLYHASCIGRHFEGSKVLYLGEPKREYYEADERLIWRPADPKPEPQNFRSKSVRFLRDYFKTRDAREFVDQEYRNAASFDSILVNSLYSRESVWRAYGLESEVCSLGIDTELFSPQNLPKQPYVVGVGMVSPRKNLSFAIEAVALVSSGRPKLIWFGNEIVPEYGAEMRRLAASKGVDLDLRIKATDEELVRTLGQATACLCAARLEPFGFAPLEANACGTAAIAVEEAGMRETVVNGLNGFLVGPNPQEMADKISQLIAEPELANALGRRAAEHVATEWTWSKAGERLDNAIRRAVASHKK